MSDPLTIDADRMHAIFRIAELSGKSIAASWEWLDRDDAMALQVSEALSATDPGRKFIRSKYH